MHVRFLPQNLQVLPDFSIPGLLSVLNCTPVCPVRSTGYIYYKFFAHLNFGAVKNIKTKTWGPNKNNSRRAKLLKISVLKEFLCVIKMTFGNPIELNSTGQTCSLHFFKNVKNGLEIRKKLMSGQIDATIINAELIPDVLQIFVAANKASLSHSNVSFAKKPG